MGHTELTGSTDRGTARDGAASKNPEKSVRVSESVSALHQQTDRRLTYALINTADSLSLLYIYRISLKQAPRLQSNSGKKW